MENIPLLKDLVILMAVSVPMSVLLTRAGLPTVIGFLLTGVIIGPYGFALVTEIHTVETLSEIGVVLLLFTIGLEFSIARMLNIRREGLIGGGLQVGVTFAIVLVAGSIMGFSFQVSMLLGFIIALSSTAIVLKLLTDKGDVSSPQGNLSVGILIFQDLCVVLMVMVVQSIGGSSDATVFEITKGLAFSLAAFAAIVVAVIFIIPRFFNQIVKLRNREVFILSIALICMGTAWVTSLFGLSLALGAFIAGLAISESEYSNQIVAEVIPFRDTFSALFFVSIGMLLNIQYFLGNLPMLLALVACIVVGKIVIIAGVGRILKYPLRVSMVVGLSLAQIGEFSFILIKMGRDYSLLGDSTYQSLLAASIVSMAMTPFVYQWASRIAFKTAMAVGAGGGKAKGEKSSLSNHVIVVGYGVNGRNLSRVLKETSVPHLVTDVNINRVRDAKAAGHKAYFGDLSHPEVFKKMGVEKAKMVVIAISDPISTRVIVRNARELNPAVSILVRTRYLREVEDLYKLGANQVIPEEFETSVEIFARVLRDYRIPGNIIQNQIDLVREEGYAMFRNPSIAGEKLTRLTSILEKTVMDTFFIDSESFISGKTLNELGLRKNTGTTIIAIVRDGQVKTNPPSDYRIEGGDILVLFGSHAQLNAALGILNEKGPDTA